MATSDVSLLNAELGKLKKQDIIDISVKLVVPIVSYY